ncbi:MAG TPA: FG-GAP-like repeat-containing protein, partial [Verrucomicrobiae bacterium]|nr:FG-GAP-like repeat-containing protein [Verrucomicrobiae bacterium]
MKIFSRGVLLVSLVFGLGLLPASAQVLDHLRALAGTRFTVGDPSITVTNHSGLALDGPKDIAVADLDGDGNQDFAASDKDGSVTVYFGKGDGTFSAPLYLRTWTTAPRDAHGYSITNYVTNACTSIWTNNWMSNGVPQTNWSAVCVPGTTNIYTNVILIADGTTGLRGLALADFTGDGLRDIAVASPGESLIYLLVNVSGRDFADAIEIPAWFGVRDLVAGDFDGDGLTDLVAAGTTNGIAQYHSLGGGAFEVVTNLPNFATDDLEFDFPQPAFYLKALKPPGATRDELAVGRAQGAPVEVLAANSDGRLAVQATLSNVTVHALDVGALLHERSSGTLDLVSVNHNDDLLEIHAATDGSSRFDTNLAVSIPVPGRAHGVAIADLDNDGWNDLVVVLQRFDKVRVLHNNHGTFELASELTVGAGPRELAIGDFTGDGRSDAAVLNRGSSDVSVLLAHPTAFGFGTLDMIYPADGEVVALQVYDFNGDGRADVVQIHRAAGQMSVRLARPDGTLSEPVFYDLGMHPSDMRSVDVNNDGILDIVAADLSGFVSVRLGRGDGTFGPEIRSSLQAYAEGGWSRGQLFSLVAADFDGDGNLDVAAGYMDCRIGLFKGNGDGTFTHTHTHLLGYEMHGMAAGDFDGDGDIDLVAAQWDGKLVVVENRGDLLTTTNLARTIITSGSAPAGAWTVLVTDYNHDGDLDVLVDGRSLYLGGPGLDFTWAQSLTETVVTVSPVTGDFNGDGFADVIAGCVNRNCVSISLGRADGSFDQPFFINVPSSQLIATGDLDGDGLPDIVGTGEVLWTALSSRAPALGLPPAAAVQRPLPGRALINEVLAANSSIPLAQDGGRMSDFVELFNGGGTPLPLLNWKLRLERTNNVGLITTNDYSFPTNAIIDAGQHLVLVCSDKLRSPFHTGFTLPAEGATVCLIRADGVEADRVNYPGQQSDHAYARFQDGVNGFVVTDTPTPGRPNADTGLIPPDVSIEDVDLATLQPNQPIRFFARATDDLGVVNVSILWRRLDIPDDATKRVILYDDGIH